MSIDYVVPMVFQSDPSWQKEWARNFGKGLSYLEISSRWRSWNTEELLIRAVMKNMPWLRSIHVLIASPSQEQEWMKILKAQDPRFKIHYHSDFIPSSLLPCFNVCTFEMFLHCIPDLSECFLYGNDDMFPLSPLQPEDFFRLSADGNEILPCQHHNIREYPSEPNIFHRFCMGGLNMVAKDFGKHFTTTWLRGGHSIAPILRSTCEILWELHGSQIRKSFTNARDDRNFNQYIYSYYQHLSGRYIDHVPKHQFVSNKSDIGHILSIIKDSDPGIVCINDYSKADHWKEKADAVRKALEERLSIEN